MKDFAKSLVRTYVPVGVGGALGWLASLGVNVDPDHEAGITGGLVGVGIATYYAAARAAEERWPWAGSLLGVRGHPEYADETTKNGREL